MKETSDRTQRPGASERWALASESMTMSMRMGAVGAILAMMVLTVVAQEAERQVATLVVAEKQTVRLGEPICFPSAPRAGISPKTVGAEVAPLGRARVEGVACHFCRNHMQGEAVYLWFTMAESKMAQEQTSRTKVHYLGRAHELYLYAAVDKNTPPLWPTATQDISMALRVSRQ